MKIFIDLDGVLADWLGAAEKTCNMNFSSTELRDKLKQGIWLDRMIDGDQMWKTLDERGVDWWANLELLPWAKRLVEEMSKYGRVAFLTSPANLLKHETTAMNASAGKTKWCNKHFNGVPLIIAYHKDLCASSDALLIDDSSHKVEAFEIAGGHTFLWPNQYLIEDENMIDKVMENLVKKIKSIGRY